MEKQDQPAVTEATPAKKEFNPLWFLGIMGALIAAVLIFELTKAK